MPPDVSFGLYVCLISAVAAERMIELLISRRHQERLLARGAYEADAEGYPPMVAFQVLFIAACPIETLALGRPFVSWIGVPMLALVACAMALRYWAVATLGDRWTTRVIV